MAFESFEDASALYPYDSDANIDHLVVPSRSRKKQRRRRSICRNPNYNLQQKKIQFMKKRELIYSPKSSIIPTMINSPTPTHEYSFNFMRTRTVTKYPQKRRRQKRRIRTFYSKKWGNRLYNIVQSNYPILNPPKTTTNYPLNPIQADIQLRHTNHLPFCCQQEEIAALHTFVEEENLDLNDIKSVRSVSPSASPIHLNISPGDHGLYYDSAISNIAATTEDEEEKSQQRRQCAVQNKNNIHNKPNNHNTTNSKFKIIVSAPDEFTDADRINDALLRQQMKLRKRGFMGSDIESAASSDDCSSCEEYDGHSSGNDEDDEDDVDEREQEEVEDDDDDVDVDDEDSIYNQQHKLFLSHNNLDRGIYSRFEYSDSETDYLSAQSDDYEELTICYRNRQDRNIKFRRDQHLNVADCNYLSDLGPSDIGSSDTDCFSSADSIPDSLPPPVQPQYIAM